MPQTKREGSNYRKEIQVKQMTNVWKRLYTFNILKFEPI